MDNGAKRVVITGLGAVTPIGLNVKDYWANQIAGKSGTGLLTTFDVSNYQSRIAAQLKDYDPLQHFNKKDARKLDRFVQYAIVAAREALADSGLDLAREDCNRIGVFVGSGIGGIAVMEEQKAILDNQGNRRVSPFMVPKLISNMAAGNISIELGIKGPNCCIVTACAAGTHSVGEAFCTIKRGDAIAMLAGGTEACITPLGLAGFCNMHALSRNNDNPTAASRPFDRDRDGFVLGEGSGILVLEELQHAKARGAEIYCEVAGYGLSGDAYHITAPAEDGNGGARAMTMCLDNAGINPEDLDYINAHGTSTPINDKVETLAIKTALGEYAYKTPVASIKGMIGHLLGAAGAVEAISMAKTIVEGVIPPTINYENPDPDCDLDYVPNEAREAKVRTAISNSLGFGGHNGTIAFKKFED
jgi:3-oxoacyl-[acyl-carrier-protein] synthase II